MKASRVLLLSGTLDAIADAEIQADIQALGLEECGLDAVPDDCLLLACGAHGLELRTGDAPTRRGVSVGPAPVHPERQLTRRQPLARAIGPGRRQIYDATAGYGEDALRLAALGHRILAVERSPVIALLLADAKRRADPHSDQAEIWDRIDLRCGDSRELLPELAPRPQVVYLDPLFPPKRKSSALPPRPIQILRRLQGPETESAALLEVALACCEDRVVLKRPRHVDPLLRPAVSYGGKLVRYDVYHPES